MRFEIAHMGFKQQICVYEQKNIFVFWNVSFEIVNVCFEIQMCLFEMCVLVNAYMSFDEIRICVSKKQRCLSKGKYVFWGLKCVF